MTNRGIEERGGGFSWVPDVDPERPEGRACLLSVPGDSTRKVHPGATRPELSEREAFAEAIADLTRFEGARIQFGTPAGVVGVAIAAHSVSSSGVRTRLPNPGKIEQLWRRNRIGNVAWIAETYFVVCFLFDTASLETGICATVAGETRLDAWCHAHDLRPVEYAPRRWRGGLVVEHRENPLGPIDIPPRGSVVLVDRFGEELSAEELIREAERIEAPPPVEIPPHVQARAPGPLGRLLNSITGR